MALSFELKNITGNQHIGLLKVHAKKVPQDQQAGRFKIYATDIIPTANTLDEKFFLRVTRITEDSIYNTLYESELVDYGKRMVFREFDILLRKLCFGDFFKPFIL
jgi:hypothetical protein